MRVGKSPTLSGETVYVRRLYLCFALAGEVSVPEVIRENDNNIRLAWFTIGGMQRGNIRKQQRGEER